MIATPSLFQQMVSVQNLFDSWNHFKRGKRKKRDVQTFERDLEDNILRLHEDLISFKYAHGRYQSFKVTDPKERNINAASVRDRLVHQIITITLTKIVDKVFIFHSLSCRLDKGTHFGVSQLRRMTRKVSANNFHSCFALKMDIKRFFDHIDHTILKTIIRHHIFDPNVLKIIDCVIDSFTSGQKALSPVGIPLGNLTSQLFSNLYLNELDDFVKQTLREHFYLRYSNDFIILSRSRSHLKALISPIREFLRQNLHLELHPQKIIIRELNQGIDFLGYVLFPKHILLRHKTKKRLKKNLKNGYRHFLNNALSLPQMDQKLQSYLGILSHANEYTFSQALKNAFWVRDP